MSKRTPAQMQRAMVKVFLAIKAEGPVRTEQICALVGLPIEAVRLPLRKLLRVEKSIKKSGRGKTRGTAYVVR